MAVLVVNFPFEVTGLSVDHFGLLRRLWEVCFLFQWQISSGTQNQPKFLAESFSKSGTSRPKFRDIPATPCLKQQKQATCIKFLSGISQRLGPWCPRNSPTNNFMFRLLFCSWWFAAKPMVCMRVAFHENDGILKTTETAKMTTQRSQLQARGVDCWICGNHGKHGNDENHGNTRCKPWVPKTTGLEIPDFGGTLMGFIKRVFEIWVNRSLSNDNKISDNQICNFLSGPDVLGIYTDPHGTETPQFRKLGKSDSETRKVRLGNSENQGL